MNNLALQPHLKSTIVTLSPLVADDWAGLFEAASDPMIWASHPATDRWKEAVFRQFFELALASGGALTVRNTASDTIVGTSRFSVERAGPSEVEIGWTFLSRNEWGGPANTAMKRLMIEHALRSFDRVIFAIGEENNRSRRAIKKIGGALTNRIFEVIIGGKLVSHVVYSIDKDLFVKGPLSKKSFFDLRASSV